jgi:hypothetical protein
LEQAATALETKGIRMPSLLRALLRTVFTKTWEAGAEAQREVILLELETTPEGRVALEKSGIRRPGHSP